MSILYDYIADFIISLRLIERSCCAHVGMTRVRAITMLTPAAQEKKDQRILEKTQSQAVNAAQAK